MKPYATTIIGRDDNPLSVIVVEQRSGCDGCVLDDRTIDLKKEFCYRQGYLGGKCFGKIFLPDTPENRLSVVTAALGIPPTPNHRSHTL